MMLVTRPDYEPGVRYLSAWASLIIDEAKRKDVTVIDLSGKKARKKEVVGRLRKKRPALVILNGHGARDRVSGQDAEILIRTEDNAALLEGSVTYAVSCDSAAVLGEEVGALPDTAYVGYQREFAMFQSVEHLARPLSDPIAKPFMEFSNHVAVSLLKGHPAAASVERAKSVGTRLVSSMLASTADPDAQAAARYLWWDVQGLVCKGKQDKCI